MSEDQSDDLIDFTIDIVSSYVGQNTIAADAVPAFITSIHTAIKTLADPTPSAESQATFTPAVTVRKSLANPDHILSMIDGKPYKTLRRHITGQGLTVEQYRERIERREEVAPWSAILEISAVQALMNRKSDRRIPVLVFGIMVGTDELVFVVGKSEPLWESLTLTLPETLSGMRPFETWDAELAALGKALLYNRAD